MTVEPRRLIPDYLPDPNGPAVQPPITAPYSLEHSHQDRLERWDRSSIPELRLEHKMLCRTPRLAFMRSVLERVLARRLRNAAAHGSAAE